MPVPLLAVEVGNSRWKCGLFPPGANDPAAVLRLAHADDPAAPLRAFFKEHRTEPAAVRAVVAGVNPGGADRLLARWPAGFAAPDPLPRLAVDRRVANLTRQPAAVGTDRLLNALAAAALFAEHPAPPAVAVADCGTATTVDVILPGAPDDPRPRFTGGAILPGAALCVSALHQFTALLPEVRLSRDGGDDDLPADGLDTAAAIRRGVLEMQAAAVERLLGDAADGTALPVLTGGAAGMLRGRLRTVTPRADPHLTLRGLAIAAGRGS